jgi:2-oxoisovalerate dehydrogenase E2 component (dihydrolipoyl transacylase)
MADYVFKLPDVGEGVAEAEVVEWHVAEGEAIAEDAPLVDVMTDKATVELTSPVAGTITRLGAAVGDVVAVGSELVRIDAGDAATDTKEQPAPPASEPVERVEEAKPAPTHEPAPPAVPTRPEVALNGARPLAAPAVRLRARSLGIDLATVPGSGPGGRVVHADLDAILTSGAPSRPPTTTPPSPAPTATSDDVEAVKVVGLRRNIAARMDEAHRIPHFTYVEEIDVTELERLRATLNQQRGDRPNLTVLPLLMRAVVIAVAEFPQMNAHFRSQDGIVERSRAVHLGIATQTAKGLMVPVVKHAERRDVWDSAAEVARLADAARQGTITLDELRGSTITITSLGALGGVASTPIINAPEVAIIGVNKIVERPVRADGAWLPRQMMNLSSSFDHRVIDGWDAARFIQRLRQLLETAALLFVPADTPAPAQGPPA